MCERESEGAGGIRNDLEWQKVSHHRSQKGKQSVPYGGPITKFYVANIPDGCRPWDLADVMKRFGSISGVFIAKKRNKEGIRFGFVSFKNVKDPKDLEKELQHVKVGKWSLKINIAWHARENEDLVRPSSRPHHPLRKPIPSFFTHRFFDPVATRKGFSFSDAVRGSQSGSSVEVVISIDDEVMGMSAVHN